MSAGTGPGHAEAGKIAADPGEWWLEEWVGARRGGRELGERNGV